MKLIEETWASHATDLDEIGEGDTIKFSELLVGHKVTKVADDHLQLDDGTLLKFVGNDGGCSCGSGDYELTELNGVDNIITAVELVNSPDGDDRAGDGTYRIFVFADNQRINLATFEGTDGNGWYGTGYSVLIRRPQKENDMDLAIDDPTPSDDEAGMPEYDPLSIAAPYEVTSGFIRNREFSAALVDDEADPKLGPINEFDRFYPKNEVYAGARPQADDQP
jgi:hypothetical protein